MSLFLEQIAMVGGGIGLLIEYIKPGLKLAKVRLGLSDFQYQVMIYVVAGLVGAAVVAQSPAQWDFLRESDVFGYPRWAGNVLSVVALAGGNSVAHMAIEMLKRLGGVSNPEPEAPVVG